jgi:vesicle-fusing ATPase
LKTNDLIDIWRELNSNKRQFTWRRKDKSQASRIDYIFVNKNFSGAEIEGLVKAATSTAMNRLIKASSKVEVDPEAMEKILVTSVAIFPFSLIVAV